MLSSPHRVASALPSPRPITLSQSTSSLAITSTPVPIPRKIASTKNLDKTGSFENLESKFQSLQLGQVKVGTSVAKPSSLAQPGFLSKSKESKVGSASPGSNHGVKCVGKVVD